MQVELDASAHFTGWDILCLGRPGAHETFGDGRVDTTIELRRNTRLSVFERMRWQGSGEALSAVWGLRKFPVVGTVYLHRPQFPDMETFIGDLSESDLELGGTLRSNWYILRGRGLCPIRMREKFWNIISKLHNLSSTASLLPPTIWNY